MDERAAGTPDSVCRWCGYDQRVLADGRCPECGIRSTPVSRQTFLALRLIRGGSRAALILLFLGGALAIIAAGVTLWAARLPPVGDVALLCEGRRLWQSAVAALLVAAFARVVSSIAARVGVRNLALDACIIAIAAAAWISQQELLAREVPLRLAFHASEREMDETEAKVRSQGDIIGAKPFRVGCFWFEEARRTLSGTEFMLTSGACFLRRDTPPPPDPAFRYQRLDLKWYLTERSILESPANGMEDKKMTKTVPGS